MKEKWEEFQALLETVRTLRTREYFLMLAVCVLSGLVAGMLISPKKRVMIGSNNGNNNVGGVKDTAQGEANVQKKTDSREQKARISCCNRYRKEQEAQKAARK